MVRVFAISPYSLAGDKRTNPRTLIAIRWSHRNTRLFVLPQRAACRPLSESCEGHKTRPSRLPVSSPDSLRRSAGLEAQGIGRMLDVVEGPCTRNVICP